MMNVKMDTEPKAFLVHASKIPNTKRFLSPGKQNSKFLIVELLTTMMCPSRLSSPSISSGHLFLVLPLAIAVTLKPQGITSGRITTWYHTWGTPSTLLQRSFKSAISSFCTNKKYWLCSIVRYDTHSRAASQVILDWGKLTRRRLYYTFFKCVFLVGIIWSAENPTRK